MNKIRQHWPVWLGLSILISVIFYYAIFNGSVQVFDYDMIEQGVRFVLHGYRWIRDFNFPLWDWNHFMGASTFSHGFYFIFSPFWLLFNLLPKIDWVPYAFLYVNILKHVLLFVTSYIYFSEIRKSKLAVYAGSSILTFCGFALGYYNYSHFIDVFLFVPIVLYYIERYLKNGTFKGFVITIAIMAIINGYFLYFFTIYFFIYAIYRYLMIHQKIELVQLFKTGGKFFLYYLLGIGLGSVIFIPSIYTMLGSPRLNIDLNIFRTITRFDLFRYLTGLLSPIVDRNNFNPYVNVYNVPSYGWSGGGAVYSLIITPLLLTQLLVFPMKKRERIIHLIFLTLLLFFAVFPSLYLLLNGSNDTRWMVLYTLFFAYIVTIFIDQKENINLPLLVLTAIGIILSFFIAIFIARRYNIQTNEIYLQIANRNHLILTFILLMYVVGVSLRRYKQLSSLIIIIALIFESFLGLYNIFLNPVDSISMSKEKLAGYQLTNTDIIDFIEKRDSSIYRISSNENAGFNNPMSKDYLGFTFYTSVYNYNTNDFLTQNISSAGGWVVGSNPGKWQFKTMFGAKYWYDTQLMFDPAFGYDYIGTVKYDDRNVEVYENQYAIPLIYSMDETLSYDTWKQLDGLHKMHTLMSNVVLEDSTDTIPEYPNTLFKIDDFSTSLDYTFDQNQSHAIVYVSYPRSEEVTIKLFDGEELIETHYSYEPQYSSVYTTKTFNRVVIDVTNLYGVPEEEFINSVYIEYPNETYPLWHSDIMKNAATEVKLGTNSFNATINLDQEKWIVSSIAYDDNWTIKINGAVVDYEKVNGGFIGLMGQMGVNSIEAHYFPKILIPAILISVISFCILVYLINKYNKSNLM